MRTVDRVRTIATRYRCAYHAPNVILQGNRYNIVEPGSVDCYTCATQRILPPVKGAGALQDEAQYPYLAQAIHRRARRA